MYGIWSEFTGVITISKLGNPVLISVPVHGNKPLKKGTLKALLQKADLLDKI